MFQRFTSSWELMKASMAVLRQDKELLVFPLVSSLAMILVVVSFFVPMTLAYQADSVLFGSRSGTHVFVYLVGFFFYLVQYFIIIFANSALVGAALIRLEGGDPTLADGFNVALDNLEAIWGYAVISATVGMILRIVEERAGWLGTLVARFLGMAWNVTTFLVIPVLVVEGIRPIDAVKRSGQLLRQTWGNQIIGNASIGVVFMLVFVVIVVVGFTLSFMALAVNPILGAVVIALLVLAVGLLGLVHSALTGIYTAAVYHYATADGESSYFSEDVLRSAFRPR